MITSKILDVETTYPDDMKAWEASEYVQEQLKENPRLRLAAMEIRPEPFGNMVNLYPHYDTVVRVRRITGYLSTLPRFNDAKKDEEQARVRHYND